jgi:hypothetical protein
VATYGVLPTGFLKKPLAVIEDEVDEDLRAILGDSAGTDADGKIPLRSAAGQLKTKMVDREASFWDLMEATYSSLDPSQAGGTSQDIVASLTGSLREAQRYSSVIGTCTGTPLTVIIAGRVATVEDTGSRFASLVVKTIAALTAWAATTAYVVGDRRTNANRVYVCTVAGTSAGSGGPTTTDAAITDNTVTWKYVGEGTGAVDVDFQAEVAGAIGALAGKLNAIATPVDGWKTVTNLLDAEVGNLKEADSNFRARRDQELAAPGNTTVDAIRANILKVNEGSTDPNHEPPTACKVFYNDTDNTDSNGLPPHSVEVLVREGTDQDITQAVWDSVGGGTRTYGNTSGVATDSEGQPQTVYWTRPTPVPMYVTAVGRYNAELWPSGSEVAVANLMLSAFLTYAADFPLALDVRASPLNGAIMRGPAETDDDGDPVVPASPDSVAVPGLLEVESLTFGTTVSPVTSTQVAIAAREYAEFDSARCVFTATTEEP